MYMVECIMCGREISDPAQCIVYDGYRFDRSTCVNIFRKFSFIYESAFLDILKS